MITTRAPDGANKAAGHIYRPVICVVFDHKALLKHFQESGKTVIYALPQKTIYKLLETTCFKNQFCVSELVHLALISFNKNVSCKTED